MVRGSQKLKTTVIDDCLFALRGIFLLYSNLDEITKRNADELRKQGFPEKSIVNLLEQSKINQTSPETAKNHIVQTQPKKVKVSIDENAEVDTSVDKKINPVAKQTAASDQSMYTTINNEGTSDQNNTQEVSLTDTDIENKINDKVPFTDGQLKDMNQKQLYHVLRTLGFANEGKVPGIYEKVIELNNANDLDGMKDLATKLQGEKKPINSEFLRPDNIKNELQSIGINDKIRTNNQELIDDKNDIVEVDIPKDKYPEYCQHVIDAINNGHPEVLTINRNKTKENRKASLKGYEKIPGKDLDEYPPAMFEEGGLGASVRPMDKFNNRGAGSTIGYHLRIYPNGIKVKFKIKG